MVRITVTVITGSGTGIGKATAELLARRGHLVIVTARKLDVAESVVAGIIAEGGNAHAKVLDVTDPEASMRLVREVLREHGSVDAWVNNAGSSLMIPFLSVTPEQLKQTIEVNVNGVFFCSQAAGSVMVEQGHGRIVNIASMAGKMGGVKYLSDYVASKFAVIGLTRAMAVELAPHSITVNNVCPGFVATPMQEREAEWEGKLDGRSTEEVLQGYIDATPLGRMSIPEDTARAVAFLLSEDAGFITGESLSVNGGAYMD